VVSARGKFAAVKGPKEAITLTDFYASMPMHRYMYRPARELWPGSSVNARIAAIPLVDKEGQPVLNKKGEQIIQSASAWLDANRAVQQMTWAPGLPELIADQLIAEGGWIKHAGARVYNLYRPPAPLFGNAADPYGVWPDLADEEKCSGKLIFVRTPGSDDGWVSINDLPEPTRKELERKQEAGEGEYVTFTGWRTPPTRNAN